MNTSQQILSEITTHMKYSKHLPEKLRRETWRELCDRNRDMHIEKYPDLKNEIERVYEDFVVPKKVLASMRSFQFAGRPIELNNSRIYNCAFAHVNHTDVFAEIMFLLLGGSGVGYSVQKRHIEELPLVVGPKARNRKFVIGDSIEGWADAIKVLMEAHFYNKSTPVFVYDDIRKKGAKLITSGGKAPGPQPLKDCIYHLTNILDEARFRQLTSLEVHDIICRIADAVLAGGIRRAALICLFDRDDVEMATCKSGDWWETHPHRGRANNSAVLLREVTTKENFDHLWAQIEASNAGEPGVFWTNDLDMGSNPCCVSGDTKVLTSDGYKRADELVGKKFKAVVDGKEYDTVSDGFWETGVKDVYSVTLSSGHSVKMTKDHRVMSNDGWKELGELIVGDKIKLTIGGDHVKNSDSKDFKDGWLLGSLLGDGVFTANSARLDYWGAEIELLGAAAEYLLNSDSFDTRADTGSGKTDGVKASVSSVGLKNMAIPFGIVEDKILNDRIFAMSKQFKSGFLSGWFDADGSPQGNVSKGTSVRLSSVIKSNLEKAQLILAELGIVSKIAHRRGSGYRMLPKNDGSGDYGEFYCKDTYEIIISRKSYKKFHHAVGFQGGKKSSRVQENLNSRKREMYNDNFYEKITSIEHVGKEKVYDVTVNEAHCFNGNGVLLHNCEISLNNMQFCNLTEVNVGDVDSQEELNARARAAAFLGTLQAGYTDFHYLREGWRKQTEKEALLGVSMTGIGSGAVLSLDLTQAAKEVLKENARVAKIIGINAAARATTVKPAGTTSLVLGTSSGIHAWHAPYYIRRIRVGKDEAIYHYIKENAPSLVVDDLEKPELQAIFEFPQKAPENSIFRDESVFDQLERIKKFNLEWVRSGHRKGVNFHNVSATVYIKPDEWVDVGKWMWDNRENYTGLSVLPYFGGSYKQAPFEDIDEATYNEMYEKLKSVDLTHIVEIDDETNLTGELACAGGACEVI